MNSAYISAKPQNEMLQKVLVKYIIIGLLHKVSLNANARKRKVCPVTTAKRRPELHWKLNADEQII